MKKILMSAALCCCRQLERMPLNKSIISFMKRDMRISLKPVGLSLTVRLKNTFLTLVEMMS